MIKNTLIRLAKQTARIAIVALPIPLLIILYFYENIHGYYRFKTYCAEEHKLQKITRVDPNVGWVQSDTDSRSDIQFYASKPNVKFVRFKNNKDGLLYDILFKGGNPEYDESYDIRFANTDALVVYKIESINHAINSELRMDRYGERVIDLRNNQEIIYLTNISYSLFDRNNTLLNAPSGNTCEWYEYLGKDSNKTAIFGE